MAKVLDILRRKRDGFELSDEEIRFVIGGATKKSIPNYQLAAFLMAICTKGLSVRETVSLTNHMAKSGALMNIKLSPTSGRTVKIDKHSTGGVGDKVTVVLAPLLASFSQVAIAKLSGRSLGFTGGTIDKLESIPGFNAQLNEKEMEAQVNAIGIAVSGASPDLAPADHILYSLRDVTGTVENKFLICASVLSKKIAAGGDVIILDIKYGSGAFVKDYNSARELAMLMTDVGLALNMKLSIILSDMDQPLGKAIGNSLEILECADTLQNKGPADLTKLCVELAAVSLVEAKVCNNLFEARGAIINKLESGEAYQKFVEWIAYQQGDLNALRKLRAPVVSTVLADREGVVMRIDAEAVSRIVFDLGAGRSGLNERINPSVGLVLVKKSGDVVRVGEVLAEIHAASNENVLTAAQRVREAYTWSNERQADPMATNNLVRVFRSQTITSAL